jgi:RecB family endonuclease NucS
MARTKSVKLVVVKVKAANASKDAVMQLSRYIEAYKEKAPNNPRRMVAPSLCKDVQALLATLGLEFKALDPKKCAEFLRNPNCQLENNLNGT